MIILDAESGHLCISEYIFLATFLVLTIGVHNLEQRRAMKLAIHMLNLQSSMPCNSFFITIEFKRQKLPLLPSDDINAGFGAIQCYGSQIVASVDMILHIKFPPQLKDQG
jgi:hypothetical protein